MKGFLREKKLAIFLISFLFSIISLAQSKSLDCSNIKNGTFYFYPTNSQQKFLIIRDRSVQKEINMITYDTSFWKVTWQNNCVFNLKFIRKSQPITTEEKSFFNSHISIVKILIVKKDYYVFKGGFDSINSAIALTDTLWYKAK
jgi:hypothetical protein